MKSSERPCRKAVFLDRDGTLIREKGYLSDPSAVELEPGAGEAVRLLNEAGFAVVVVTNQSGVARGYYGEEEVHAVHQRLAMLLKDSGAHLDGVYYCPHHPEGSIEMYRQHCACRKPGTDMISWTERDLNVCSAGSYMVGDKQSDMMFASNGGLWGVLVMTGYGREAWRRCLQNPSGGEPDLAAGHLLEAVQRILAQERNAAAGGRISNPIVPRRPWSSRFTSLRRLEERLEEHRKRGETVVMANGVFDLFHAGHAAYLQGARDLGDRLIVAVNDDRSTVALKGPDRPVFPVEERVAIVGALACVDYCVVFREETVDGLLRTLRPDIHAKGTDYSEDSVPERETTESLGGAVRIVGPPRTRSTTDILRLLGKK